MTTDLLPMHGVGKTGFKELNSRSAAFTKDSNQGKRAKITLQKA